MNWRLPKILLTLLLCLGFFQANAMTTRGSEIINSEGDPVDLKGVNWFGFNNQSTMVDGLWGGPGLSVDFASVVYRLQLLGFNAVRLPFSFTDLYDLKPKDYVRNCTFPTIAEIQASVTNPSHPVAADKTIPPMIAPPSRHLGLCNDYLPRNSTFDRYVWVVNFFAQNGFYVLVDNHLREDQLALKDKGQWLEYWKELVAAISEQPAAKDRLMIDILNEPDNYGLRWDNLQDLYLSAMDAISPINDKALFFIEGTGQGGIDANWGDGFATDPKAISQSGLSDPNPFFKALMAKPYLNQVVISPHIYPPSVTNANKNYTGAGLANRLSTSFGYLTQEPGYCDGTPCHVFPVAVGEFGSRFDEQKDLDSLKDLANYFNDTGALADGKHQPIRNWFYWSWNPNSGDTGGLVADNWVDIIWKKINYLTTIGLKPWYLNPGDESHPTPNPNPEPIEQPPVEEIPPVIEPPPSEEQPIDAGFSVSIQSGAPWQESEGIYQDSVNLSIRNMGSEPIPTPWVIEITNSHYVETKSAWNFQVISSQNGTITGTTEEQNSWQELLPHGGNTINLGMVVSSTAKDFTPQSVKINGVNAVISTK